MKKTLTILLLIFLITSCAKVPVTGRKQFRLLPDDVMMSMSLTNYQSFLKENQPLPDSDSRTKLVRKVGKRVAGATENFLKEKGKKNRIEGFKWKFNVLKDNTINAWCMPGGRIVVYSGILSVIRNELGLATVLGHEIAHAVAKHGNERMSQQLAIALGGKSLALAMEKEPEKTRKIFNMVYGVGTKLGTLAYSRKHEYEADKLSMIFMARANYDPQKAINFWQRMKAQKEGNAVPEFLSTHPTDENRIEAMKEFLPKARKHYKN